jgi:hypothetical protein
MSAKFKGSMKDCGAGTALGFKSFAANIVPIRTHIDGALHATRETRDRSCAVRIEIDPRAFLD